MNKNSIHEEIKSRFKSDNAYYHLVKDLLCSSFLSKNIKIEIYRLPVVFYKCKTWSLTLRTEHRHIAFKNKVHKKTFGPKREKATRKWRRLHK
jgi:hypothetical protein